MKNNSRKLIFGIFIIAIIAATSFFMLNKTTPFAPSSPTQYNESTVKQIIAEGKNDTKGIKCDCTNQNKNTGKRDSNDPMALFFRLECENICNATPE
ncbi:MAG: hypothetical protein ACRBDI_09840 [Alphaproteobacteria bacterium]